MNQTGPPPIPHHGERLECFCRYGEICRRHHYLGDRLEGSRIQLGPTVSNYRIYLMGF